MLIVVGINAHSVSMGIAYGNEVDSLRLSVYLHPYVSVLHLTLHKETINTYLSCINCCEVL